MYKQFSETINPGDKVIIGLGDSFTQGVGAYSTESWRALDGPPYNVTGYQYIDEQQKNNWLSQLRDNHLPDYKIINLGINGIGNRAAVKELYLTALPKDAKDVIIVFMISGINRIDFLKNNEELTSHMRWQTLWPIRRNHAPIAKMEKEYLEQVYSVQGAVIELLLTIAEAQTFANANGYKFAFGSAFDDYVDPHMVCGILDKQKDLAEIVDWNNFIRPKGYKTFMEMMRNLEPDKDCIKTHWYSYCGKLTEPSEYLTPCSHWSIKGQATAAEEIYKHLVKNEFCI